MRYKALYAILGELASPEMDVPVTNIQSIRQLPTCYVVEFREPLCIGDCPDACQFDKTGEFVQWLWKYDDGETQCYVTDVE